ncbi:urease subunit beta [Spongiactinospora sp. TRM90649]|nr:urease subunit beta [Spongiactinospora sp. TRM90649]MDF5756118.1 urease subunit beta [Spongiactinospora sp. TRM90649]
MAVSRIQYANEPIEINTGRPTVTLTVRNTGDRAIQVGSHFHFFEANRALAFDREKAFGKHLDIPAGTAVRIEPGDTHRVTLVEYGGGTRIIGFNNLLDGGIRARDARTEALRRMKEYGFTDKPEPSAKITPAQGKGAAAKASAAKTPSAKTPSARTPSTKASTARTPSTRTSSARTSSAKASSTRTSSARTPSARVSSAKASTAKTSVKASVKASTRKPAAKGGRGKKG